MIESFIIEELFRENELAVDDIDETQRLFSAKISREIFKRTTRSKIHEHLFSTCRNIKLLESIRRVERTFNSRLNAKVR